MGDIADYYREQEMDGFDLDEQEAEHYRSRRSAFGPRPTTRKNNVSDQITITTDDVKRAALATGNSKITLLEVAEFLEGEDSKYVQVTFNRGGRRYLYECAEACKVGECVVAPPNDYTTQPQIVTVVKLGRKGSGWDGPCKNVLRIPTEFQPVHLR